MHDQAQGVIEPHMEWKRRLTCGQMAKANCVSEKALRFYRKKGILEPECVDASTGFRYYGIVQSTKLDMISHLQCMGFSLDEIKGINDRHDIGHLRDEAVRRLAGIQQQRQELDMAERLAADLIDDCSSYLDMPPCYHPVLENIADRYILEFDLAESVKEMAGGGLTASDRWEWALRSVKKTILERGWPITLFRKVGFIADRNKLLDPDTWIERLFVFVDPSFGECFEHARLLPGGTHIVYYIDKGYDPQGESRDNARFEAMEAFAKENGFIVSGDSYCEAISRYQRFFHTGLDSFSRYCMPIVSAE